MAIKENILVFLILTIGTLKNKIRLILRKFKIYSENREHQIFSGFFCFSL
jgi:hypothetical protein